MLTPPPRTSTHWVWAPTKSGLGLAGRAKPGGTLPSPRRHPPGKKIFIRRLRHLVAGLHAEPERVRGFPLGNIMITGVLCTKKIRRYAADSLSLSYPSHQLEDERWPGPTAVYRAPHRGKSQSHTGRRPGLTGVTPDQEGLQDDPGSQHVVALAPPRTPLGTPWGARTKRKAQNTSG